DPFPRHLAAVVTPDALLLPPTHGAPNPHQYFDLQLVALGGETPVPAQLGSPGVEAHELVELWVAEYPLLQTGFYAGQSSGPEEGAPTDNSTAGLKDVPREGRYES